MNFLSKKHKEKVQMYVGSHLIGIMEEQEKRLGIRHFGIPKIAYDAPGWLSPFLAIFMVGSYNGDFNEIYLRHQKIIMPNRTLNNILPVISPFSNMDAKAVLEHELAHFYADKLSKSLGLGQWPRYGRSIEENIIKKLVSEGIAEYFRITSKENKETKKLIDWTGAGIDVLARAGAIDENIRNYGFHLVKPILDVDVKEGITHFLKNMPNIEDLNNVPQYQANVAGYLAKSS